MGLLRVISILLFVSFVFAKEINVYAIVEGEVKRVYVKEGQKVKKGELLVEIDPVLYTTKRDALSARLESQRLALEKVEKDFKRYEELYNRDLLSKSEYEDWKNRYDREKQNYLALQAELNRISKLIEYCQIKAPSEGVVKKIFVREGVLINGTQTPQLLLIIEERD